MIVGTVIDGPYRGQQYMRGIKGENTSFAFWVTVLLTDERGHRAVRDVPERFLDQP